MAHHYAFEAAFLLEKCLQNLSDVIEVCERSSEQSSFFEMKGALIGVERQLFDYFRYLFEHEISHSPPNLQERYEEERSASLSSCADRLKSLLEEKSRIASEQAAQYGHVEERQHCYYAERSATDSLLFRLIVALQLCLVRIDDAHLVLVGRRKNEEVQETSNNHVSLAITGSVGLAAAILTFHHFRDLRYSRQDYRPLVYTFAKAGFAALTVNWLCLSWGSVWMSTKINKSTGAVVEWTRQWHLIQGTTVKLSRQHDETDCSVQAAALDAERSQKLVEYALHDSRKFSLWNSQGELRFLMLKKAMDVFYASVGTAMQVTHGHSEPDWQLMLSTAAAASFYSLTGASKRAAEATSSSRSARELIRAAWGMVSLPAIKNLSLQASRLIKGAAVADRIEVCGVSCFVLSAEPAPELAAAIAIFQRRHARRQQKVHKLATIDEQAEHTPAGLHQSSSKPFARSCTRYRQRDVIFHLTGGGFFAHIIASDLPYLLDWSASTGAVVICPEYDLLPQHTFPDALNQVTDVYRALVSGEAVPMLGFEVDRIVVTGESAGGNLAAALCVKLCMDNDNNEEQVVSSSLVANDAAAYKGKMNGDVNKEDNANRDMAMEATQVVPLPDALMLSCPVLNLSLELSHSRVVGTEDPVLPSGLISAISDAYVPPSLGVSKKDPLASPFYASDSVLSRFPPTLLFASSNDPLLDDSVVFNQRLLSLGVPSELRAAQNLPHAYLGLGTAGFPEAVQVQRDCQQWLAYQLTRDRET